MLIVILSVTSIINNKSPIIAETNENYKPVKNNAIVMDGILTAGEYEYDHNIQWGRYNYSYTIIGDTIYMALRANALGWISAGIGWYSFFNQMADSDVATGYVDDSGQAFMDDYWSTGDPGPLKIAVPDYDAQQDIIAFNGTQDSTYTTFEWSKKLNTGDTAQDNEIIPGAFTMLMVARHSTSDNPGWYHDGRYDIGITFYGNPSAPRNLTALPYESRVELSWVAPAGNGGTALTNYKVYRSFNGGTYQLLTTQNDTSLRSYSDTTVLNGQNYTYRVTASNTAIGHKESGFSDEVSVIPMGPLLNPNNLTANSLSQNVTLTWEYPVSDGGIQVEKFKLYKTFDNETYNLFEFNSSTFKYNDYDIINGFTYYYYILAEHQFLTSSPSPTISALPLGNPAPPQNLSIGYTDNQAILMWDIPVSDGGYPIMYYIIYRSDTQDGLFSFLNSTNDTIYNDYGVSNGETYYYKIVAVNSEGNSNPSDIQKITLAQVPTIPSNLVVQGGAANISLSWEASDPKGYTILLYSIYRSDGKYNPFTILTTVNTLTYIDLNVTNSKEYYYKITANNSVGESSYSNTASAIPASPPSEPINLRIKNINGGIKINWDEPESNGGYFISHYTIERRVGDAVNFTKYGDSQSKEFKDNSVDFGVKYTYKLQAHNTIGVSPYSSSVSVIPGNIPSKPTNVKTEIVNGDVALSWNEPESFGYEITSYNIYRSIGTNFNYMLLGTSKILSYSDDTNSSLVHYYRITAVNEKGEGDLSDEVNIVSASVSSPPINLIGIAGNNETALMWNVPENDGGLAISSYNIYMAMTNDTVKFEKINNSTALIISVDKLNNNQTYYFYVTAMNEIGESDASNIVSVTPQKGYVDPNILLNDSKVNNFNNNNTSELDVEQIGQTVLTLLGIGAVGMALFVIRMFIQNKFRKETSY